MINWHCIRITACAMAIVSLLPNRASAINSAVIAAETINPATLPCFDHCVIGLCFYLRITLTGPQVETRLKVKHYFPDIVVTVFEHYGDQPWIEAMPASAVAGAVAQSYGLLSQTPVSGGRHTPAMNQMQSQASPNSQDTRRLQLRFSEVEIYGHPLASVIGQNPLGFGVAVPGICPVKTISLFPYFQSGTDVLSWRNPEAELIYPASYIPYLREVRNSTSTSIWGSVFPRNGFIDAQSDPYQAAAVLAQRAADITTTSLNPHVYIRAQGAAANELTDRWQQLYPKPSASCGPFGGLRIGPTIPAITTLTQHDSYVWALWRPYNCCLPNPGATYVTEVITPAVCLRLP